jgi:RNA polymerase sigma factor for flagellar operon FliA
MLASAGGADTEATMAASDAQDVRRLSPEDALDLWREYRASGDTRVRDRLVLTFAPLVKYIVYRKVREIPARCDVEDFISCGLEALIRALDRYDPEKGATIEQFAWTRIHGAVLDELRRQDWAPRSLRRWERDIARAQTSFLALHDCRPTDAELASALGVETDELRRRADQIAGSDVTSLNSWVLGEEAGVTERIDLLVSDGREGDPELSAETGAAKARFRAAFARLPRRDREVAVLLYVKDLSLREVGEILGVSESRICQIHGKLKRTLRQNLDADAGLFSDVA